MSDDFEVGPYGADRPEDGVNLSSIAASIERDFLFFFSSRRRHTRFDCDWSSDVCSSDLIRDFHVPVTVGLRPGYFYRLKVSGLPQHPEREFYPTLEVRGTLQLQAQLRAEDRKSVV